MKLEVSHYQYKNSKQPLFESLEYQVEEKRINFLIGENGAGKTTLIDLFLGFIKCESSKKDYELNRDFIYISQTLPMLGSIKCKEVAQLVLGVAYHNKNLNLEDIKEITTNFSYEIIARYWDSYYHELSGGERKLYQVVLFLQTDKNLIVLDEPSAFIDRYNVSELFNLLEEMKEKTIIIITHDYRDLKLMPDYYVSVLENAKIIEKVDKKTFEKDEFSESGFLMMFKRM